MSEQFSIKDLIMQARNVKRAFVPAATKEAAAGAPMPPMDPAMMPPPPPPGDPMAAGMPPMDPAMMGGAMPPPPPGDPMAAGMPPMDPAMMPPPPPPGPEAGSEMQELMQVVSQMAEGMDKIESKQEALETRYQDVMAQFNEMRGKIDMLINILEGKKSGI